MVNHAPDRPVVECGVCGSTTFHGPRPYAFCKVCDAAERTRFLWLYLNHGRPFPEGARVLHVAPERGISLKLKSRIGLGYEPADYEPERYQTRELTVAYINLTDLSAIPDNHYDAVMHLHVLEHLYAPLENVMRETMRIIKFGGRLIFGLPIAAGITIENIWPDPTPEEREIRFGQFDHVRLVGRDDFPRFLTRVMAPFSSLSDFRVDPLMFIDSETFLRKTGVTRDRVMSYSDDTIFEVPKDKNS